MSNEALLAVVIRLGGIWTGVYSLGMGSAGLRSLIASESVLNAVAAPAAVACIVLSVMMIVAPLRIAKWLLPKTNADGPSDDVLSTKTFQYMLVGALGLYLIVSGVMGMGNFFYGWAMVIVEAGTNFRVQPIEFGNFVPYLLKMIAGAWLMTGAKGMERLFATARVAASR